MHVTVSQERVASCRSCNLATVACVVCREVGPKGSLLCSPDWPVALLTPACEGQSELQVWVFDIEGGRFLIQLLGHEQIAIFKLCSSCKAQVLVHH